MKALVFFAVALLLLAGCASTPTEPQAPQQPPSLSPAQPNETQNYSPITEPAQPYIPLELPVIPPANATPAQAQNQTTLPSTVVNTTFPSIIATYQNHTEGPGTIIQPYSPPEPGVLQGSAVIQIKNAAFKPRGITVRKGTLVTWVNVDSLTHRIAGNGFDSGNLTTGQNYSLNFTEPGVYYYDSAYYPQIPSGLVQVIE